MLGKLRLQRVIERVPGFLVPEQPVGFNRFSVSDRSLEIETAIRVNGQTCSITHDFEHGFDAANVLGQWRASDFHFYHPIAKVPVTLHLRLERGHVFPPAVERRGSSKAGASSTHSIRFARFGRAPS